MKHSPLTGTITALVTPFSGGNVAFPELKKLVNQQIRAGINGIVPMGTTGESPTVTHDEHLEVVRTVVEIVVDGAITASVKRWNGTTLECP